MDKESKGNDIEKLSNKKSLGNKTIEKELGTLYNRLLSGFCLVSGIAWLSLGKGSNNQKRKLLKARHKSIF